MPPHDPAKRSAPSAAEASAPEALRAWDSAHPRQYDIGGWRWHDHDWRWEDARGRQAEAPAWSKPPDAAPHDGCRIPLDSALAIRLNRQDPDAADTIAPGVMAHTAAALSAGRLA